MGRNGIIFCGEAAVEAPHQSGMGFDLSDVGNCTHGRHVDDFAWLRRDVDYVAGLDFEIERNARIGRGRDAGKAQDEGRRAIARHLIAAVEQLHLGGASAGGMNGEVPQDLLAQMLGDVGRAHPPRGAEEAQPDAPAEAQAL